MDEESRGNILWSPLGVRTPGGEISNGKYIIDFCDWWKRAEACWMPVAARGIDSAYMLSKGFAVTGVDISEGMIDLAAKKNSKAHFEKADIRKLKFKPETFAGIIASYSIIHLPKNDVQKTVMGFYEMLKRGGVIYFSVQEGKSREVITQTPF